MKKQNGFIATSLIYTFFLAFVSLFIGVITLQLQNRIYLNKIEDSSKNAIYLRKIENHLNSSPGYINAQVNKATETTFSYHKIDSKDKNILKNSTYSLNASKCEKIYYDWGYNTYYFEGCN